VDALVVTPKGLFLVELKHWQGDLEGDPYTWTRTVDGRTWQEDNPLILANRKAKTFKSVLQRTSTGRARKLPFVEAVVFLTNAAQTVRLTPPARTRIVGPQGAAMVGTGGLTSIADTLVTVGPQGTGQAPRTYSPDALADAAKAISEVGIRESQARRAVRDYTLGEVLEDGDVYQDYLATHRRYREQRRRIRVYPHDRAAGDEQRTAARQGAEREFTLFAGVGHPGIEAPIDFVDHERGPSLIFDFDPAAARLDRWLTLHGKNLALPDRLAVVRAIAEALAHAHAQRIFHRALDVRAIWVTDTARGPQPRIRNWHTGVRAGGADTTTRLPTSGDASGISVDDPVTDR
ncbi:MAG: NERD domain-containing protein, partial [Actinomycetota bacterium]